MQEDISRRSFVKAGICLGVAAVLGGGAYLLPKSNVGRKLTNEAKELLQDRQVQFLRQLVTEQNDISRCIMWQSAEPMQAPQVLVRSTEGQVSKYAAQPCFFQDDGKDNCQYTALLDNLQVNQQYEYAVEDGQKQSSWYSLKTCSRQRDEFSMLIFPDSQSSDYSDWTELAQGAWQRNPAAELFVNMGDLVDNGEDSSQWHAWFHSVDGLAQNVAFAPVMGNHECYNQVWQERLPEAYLNYFQVPDNGSKIFARYYYAFDYGQVHFVVLNTCENEIQAFKSGLMQEQLAWLENDAKK